MDASEVNSLTDFQEIHLPRTRKGEKVFKFSVKDRKIVMTVAPNCEVIFDEDVNKDLAILLCFRLGKYAGGRGGYKDYVASQPFGGGGMLSFVYTYCDLVEYSYVGDTMVPCLRTLPVIPWKIKRTVLRFENPETQKS